MKKREILNSILFLCLVITSRIPFSEAAAVTAAIASARNTTGDKVPAAIEEKITEIPPEIAIEGVEESLQADRAKKSATTTFCVEIRPETSKTPVKVCDNHPTSSVPPESLPQVSHEPHEIDEKLPPPHSSGNENPEAPIFIIPPNPTEVFFPHIPPQYINIPSVVSHPETPPPQQNIIIPVAVSNAYQPFPCPPNPYYSTGASGFHPHALLMLFRSAMEPMNNALSSMNGMDMRSSGDEASGGDSVAKIPSGMEGNEEFSSEIVGSPFAGGHLKKLFGHPSSLHYNSNLHHRKFPYIIRSNPHPSPPVNRGPAYGRSSEWSRSSDGIFNAMNNQQSMTAGNNPMNMEMSQKIRHNIMQPVVQPYISTGDGYSSHSMIPSVVRHTIY